MGLRLYGEQQFKNSPRHNLLKEERPPVILRVEKMTVLHFTRWNIPQSIYKCEPRSFKCVIIRFTIFGNKDEAERLLPIALQDTR